LFVLNIYQVSGDWPGFAQEDIEKAHPGAIALFVQGAGAGANPLPRRSIELARLYGQVLAAAVEIVLRGQMKPQADTAQRAFATGDKAALTKVLQSGAVCLKAG
jgi:neutral ceramidase